MRSKNCLSSAVLPTDRAGDVLVAWAEAPARNSPTRTASSTKCCAETCPVCLSSAVERRTNWAGDVLVAWTVGLDGDAPLCPTGMKLCCDNQTICPTTNQASRDTTSRSAQRPTAPNGALGKETPPVPRSTNRHRGQPRSRGQRGGPLCDLGWGGAHRQRREPAERDEGAITKVT